MANIMITNVCDLKCEYCFADDCKRVKQQMNIFTFKKAINFATRTQDYIGIIGGEPTIHPDIKQFLHVIATTPSINRSTLFTNGLNLAKLYKDIPDKMGVLINFNDKPITKEKYEKLLENLDVVFKEIGHKVNLGVNIYKEDQDFTNVIEVLRKYDKKILRCSIVAPNTDDKRGLSAYDYYMSMKPTLIKLAKLCIEDGVVLHLDCSYPPHCIYTEEELDIIKKATDRHTHNCTPVMDILPDLTVIRCFGTSCATEPVKIDKLLTPEDCHKYFVREIDHKVRGDLFQPSCANCSEYKFERCQGGCLAFKEVDHE